MLEADNGGWRAVRPFWEAYASRRDGTHLIDSTGRHFVELELLLQQFWVAVTERTSYKQNMKMY